MLNCKEATRLCSEQMEQKLSLQQQISLRMHLLLCSACRNFATQIGDIRQAMHSYSQGHIQDQSQSQRPCKCQNNSDNDNSDNDQVTPK